MKKNTGEIKLFANSNIRDTKIVYGRWEICVDGKMISLIYILLESAPLT